MKKTLTLKKVLFTYAIFFVIWTLRVVLLKPLIDANFELWMKELINGTVKLFIWFGFAAYIIKLYESDLKIGFKEMFAAKTNAKILLSVLSVFTAYYLIGMFVLHGGFYLNPKFHPSQLIGQFLLVGILEEIVFRGWFLNSISSFIKDWKANALTSALFVLIHIPSWAVSSVDIVTIISTSVGIFILSMVLGWTFSKSKSLWTPIILHMIWDILSITVL